MAINTTSGGMSIRKKFIFLVSIPAIAISVLVAMGGVDMQKLSHDASVVYEENVHPLVQEDMVMLNNLQASIILVLEADRDVHQAKIAEKAALVASSDKEFADADKSHKENIQQARDRIKKASSAFDEKGMEIYAAFEKEFAEWEEKTSKVVSFAQDPNKFKFAQRISYGSAQKTFDTMRDRIDKFTEMQGVRIKERMEEVNRKAGVVEKVEKEMHASANLTMWVFIAVGIGTLLVLVVVGQIMARSIIRPISTAVDDLNTVAGSTGSASTEVAASSQHLAEGSSEQAASLEEMSSSLEEVNSMIQQNADDTVKANEVAGRAREMAQEGSKAITRMHEAIQEVKESSDKMATIIKTIDEIAFQTNLLALNAAVEAARAGDAGRGFAVVAEEVRNLAQRSAQAAQETNQMIEDSQNKAETGVTVSNEVGSALEKIIGAIQEVEGLVRQVTTSSREQTTAVTQVTTATNHLDQLTQRNASTAEQVAAASEELNSQSQELLVVVRNLSNIIGGSGNQYESLMEGNGSTNGGHLLESVSHGKDFHADDEDGYEDDMHRA